MKNEGQIDAFLDLRGEKHGARPGGKPGSRQRKYSTVCPQQSTVASNQKTISKIKDDPVMLLKNKQLKIGQIAVSHDVADSRWFSRKLRQHAYNVVDNIDFGRQISPKTSQIPA
jgi:hypothetical protein